MSTSPQLPAGIHAWVWPLPTDMSDWAHMCATAKRLGLTGLIPQEGLSAPGWAKGRSRAERGQAARIAKDAGLVLTLGLGMDGRNGWAQELPKLAGAVVGCLENAPLAMLNWEGKWENDAQDRDRADTVVDLVLAADPSASRRCVDAPWWAPLSVRRRVNGRLVHAATHPRAPAREFGRLCTGHRYVQAYGANVPGSPDGASTRMLEWARDPSQYPKLGISADRILPAYQGYKRTVTDHVRTLLASPVVALWVLQKFDRECRAALQFVQAIGRLGYVGPGADVRFQTAAGIPGPEIVGPRAMAAAGVVAPADLIWRRKPAAT